MQPNDAPVFGNKIKTHLGMLGFFELKFLPLLCAGGWLALWFGLGFRWWTALLLALGALVNTWFGTVRYTDWYLRRRAAEFLQAFPARTDAHQQAFMALSRSAHFSCKSDFMVHVCGLEERDYKAGLGLLEVMIRSVRRGKDPKALILETGETIKAENAFLGQEFLDNCQDLLAKENTKPGSYLIASAAKMFQVKLTLETQRPGERGKEFARAMPIMWELYDCVAREALDRS